MKKKGHVFWLIQADLFYWTKQSSANLESSPTCSSTSIIAMREALSHIRSMFCKPCWANIISTHSALITVVLQIQWNSSRIAFLVDNITLSLRPSEFILTLDGSEFPTFNLSRVLAGLTWILQHELNGQWTSRLNDGSARLCASVTKPLLKGWPGWYTL